MSLPSSEQSSVWERVASPWVSPAAVSRQAADSAPSITAQCGDFMLPHRFIYTDNTMVRFNLLQTEYITDFLLYICFANIVKMKKSIIPVYDFYFCKLTWSFLFKTIQNAQFLQKKLKNRVILHVFFIFLIKKWSQKQTVKNTSSKKEKYSYMYLCVHFHLNMMCKSLRLSNWDKQVHLIFQC